jgi:glutamyl-tRNA synthetase
LVPDNAENLRRLADVVETVEPFSNQALDEAVSAWLEKSGLLMKNVAQPARVAMTGRTKSPGLFEVMEVLGKRRTLERLRAGAEVAGAAEARPA